MLPTTSSDSNRRKERSDPTSHCPLIPAIAAIALALSLIPLGITAYFFTIGGAADEPPAGVIYGSSGIGLTVAVGVLWWYLSPNQRQTAFPLHTPSRVELGWTLAFVPFGVLAFLGGEQFGLLIGGDPLGFFAYDVTGLSTLVGVLFGAVIVAPLAEELLYRGILISALEDRGRSMLAAGGGSIAIFAATHVFALGVTGVFAIAAWAVFPTVLRLRFENLAGAWLLHLLNNIFAYLLFPLLFV